jgi:hypothetical protein
MRKAFRRGLKRREARPGLKPKRREGRGGGWPEPPWRARAKERAAKEKAAKEKAAKEKAAISRRKRPGPPLSEGES